MEISVVSICALVLLALFWGWTSPVFAEKWVSLGRGTQHKSGASIEVFLDMDSVLRSTSGDYKNYVRFDMKTIYHSEQIASEGIKFIRRIGTIFINCTNQTGAIVEESRYDRNGKRTKYWYNWDFMMSMKPPMPKHFKPFPKGSFLDIIHTRLCP